MPGVHGGRRLVVLLRLLHRLVAVERRKLRVGAMAQRDEAQLAQFLLLIIGDDHVGRAFRGDAAAVGREAMDGQIRHESAALPRRAARRGCPPASPTRRTSESARRRRRRPRCPRDIAIGRAARHPRENGIHRRDQPSSSYGNRMSTRGSVRPAKRRVFAVAKGLPFQVFELLEGAGRGSTAAPGR